MALSAIAITGFVADALALANGSRDATARLGTNLRQVRVTEQGEVQAHFGDGTRFYLEVKLRRSNSIKATTPAIVALLRSRPGLTCGEIEHHFGIKPHGAFARLIKLSAQGHIRVETESHCFHGPNRETTGAQTRRYFPPVELQAAE